MSPANQAKTIQEMYDQIRPDSCHEVLTEFDKNAIENFEKELLALNASDNSNDPEKAKKLNVLIDNAYKQISPAGQMSILAKINEEKMKRMFRAIQHPEIRNLYEEYQKTIENYLALNIGNEAHSESIEYEKRSNAITKAANAIIAKMRPPSTVSVADAKELKKNLLTNQQQVFRLKGLDIDQVVAKTSRNLAVGQAATLSLVAAGLTVGSIITLGALGGVAASVGASAGAAWGTAAYIAGSSITAAMGGAGAAGISKMIKIGFVATVEACAHEKGFWAGLGCSFAKETYLQGPTYVKSMVYGAAVGGKINQHEKSKAHIWP